MVFHNERAKSNVYHDVLEKIAPPPWQIETPPTTSGAKPKRVEIKTPELENAS